MDLLTYFVILLLPFGSSPIISQNDLAFWTLLKEYHEMDLPGQDLPAPDLSGCESAEATAAPLRLVVQRSSEEVYDSVPDDVAVRLHVEMKSEPVQLRVRCARGCRYLRSPCDLFITPGYPLRIICYATMPECMLYGYTTINCAVYSAKRWPHVVQALCTMDYHTSESICASFESAEHTAQAVKPFRLMLESLGVRPRPANWTEPLPRASHDEQVSWWLAAAGLLAVLLGAFIVLHFRLAFWTPCSWSWFEQYEPTEANNIPDRCYGAFKNALLYDPNDPGRKIEIRTGDSVIIGGFVDSKNFYKMVVVVVDSKSMSSQEMRFLLPVPTSYSYLDGDDSKRIEIRDNNFSRAPSCTYLNSHVFPTGVIESGELLHGSQTIPLGYSAQSSSAESNSLSNCKRGSSHLEDCLNTGDSALDKVESSESPLTERDVKYKSRNKSLTLETATENSMALDSSLCSTDHATEEKHTPPEREITTKKLREQNLSTFYSSLTKSKDLLSREVSSTLLTSPCPEMSYRCFTSYQATSSHQVPHSPVSHYSMSLAYPTTWVYPMILPQTIPLPFSGSPICATITQDSLNASEEVNTGSSRYSASSVHPITPAYPAALAYPNTNAFLESVPCPEAVIYSTAPTYTITPPYPVIPSGIATSTYPGTAPTYPVLPRYPQPAGSTGSPNVPIDAGSHYHGETTSSQSIVQPPDEYPENSTYRENSGFQITDYRREPTYPPTSESNREYCPDLPNYQESNVYQPGTGHLTRQCPTVSYNPASNINSRQITLSQQTNPPNEANLLGPVYRPLPRRKQTSGTNQVMNNPPAMTNQRLSINTEPRGYNNQRHSNTHRPSSDHRYFVNQGNAGYQRSSNQRPLDTYRHSTSTRSLANLRSHHQRSQAYQRATSYRPTNAHQFPLAFQPETTYQPGVPYRSCASYQMPQYQPSSTRSAVNYQMRPVYQRLDYRQPVAAYQSPSAYQQSNFQEVEQTGGVIQATCINGSRTTNQPPILYPTTASNHPTTVYETTPLQAPDHNASAPFQPTYTHETLSAHRAPTSFQETSGYQPVPVYNRVSTRQVIPPVTQHSEYQTNAYPQTNRQYIPMYQQSYVTSLPEDTQQSPANQMIPNSNATFYPVPSEGVSNHFSHPISGFCANSPCTQECPYFGSSGPQTDQSEQPYQENMAYAENTSEFHAAADHQDDNNYSNCREHQLRADCPEVFPRPNPTNMESQVVNSAFNNPPVYFYPVDWRDNYVNQSIPTPSNQLPSTSSSMVTPSHSSQIPEVREENTTLSYPLYSHTSNESEFHDSLTPAYNPVNCVYCVCNPGVPMYTAIPPDENYSIHASGQITGGGDAEVDHISNQNNIPGEICMDQVSNVIHNNETQPGYGPHVELGSGDSHLVQCYEQSAFQEQDEQYYSPISDVIGDNVCRECETVVNCYGENETVPTQYCYECSRLGYCSTCHENCHYMNGYINPTLVGQNSMMREVSNDISENFSRLSIQN